MSIFVAAEVLRWKRYVAAAARQCFENLSCKFANNCESQLCLAWERPTPPLNPILFYTVEQIKQGTTAGQEAKETSSGIMSTPTDVHQQQQQDERPPGGGKEQQPPPHWSSSTSSRHGICQKKITFICKIYFESQHRLHKIEMVDRKSNSTSTNSTRQHTLLRLWNSRHT